MNLEHTNKFSNIELNAEPEPSVKEVVTKNKQYNSLDDELLDIDQVCKILKVCKATVHNWKRQGILPTFYRIGRKVRFRKVDVISAMRKIERGRLL